MSANYELLKQSRKAAADARARKQLDLDTYVPVLPSESSQPGPVQEEPALLHYLGILIRRRWLVVGSTCALGLLAAAFSFMVTPRYEASARISVGREDASAMSLKESRNNLAQPEYDAELDAEVRVLTSDSLVLENLKRLGFANPPAAENTSSGEIPEQKLSNSEIQKLRFFQSGLEASRVGHTSLIDIRFRAPDPNVTARFVNGLVATYREHSFKTKYDATMHVSNFLGKQLADLKAKFEASQQKLVEYERTKGFLEFGEKENIVTQKLDQVNRDLGAAETDRIQRQALYERSRSENPELVREIGDNANIKHLQEQVQDLKNRFAEASSVMGSAHPKVIQLSDQLSQAKASLREEVNKIAQRDRNAYLIARSREDMLRSLLAQQKREASHMQENAIQYGILKHDVESNQQLYDGLLQKLKEAGVFAGLNSSRVSVVDSARVPNAPVSPNIPLNIALGLLAGCFLGCIGAFTLEHFDTRIHTPDEIQAIVRLPCVAAIPAIPGNTTARKALPIGHAEAKENAPGVLGPLKPTSEFSESYRALRTWLLLGSSSRAKVILVTSPLSQEGKSTTSLQLAAVLTQAQKRVLLVDGDLRAPCLHRLLGVPSDRGLSTVLNPAFDANPCEYILQSHGMPRLSFLPAGPVLDLSTEALSSEALKRLLGELRARFDYVVIDSSPVLATTDPVIVASEADAVVLTVRSGQTTKDALVRAHELLRMVGANVSGIVVNAVPTNLFGYPKYRFYGYGRDGN